jgi:hypothetical protein
MKGSNSSQTIQAFGCAPLTNRKSFCRTFAAITGKKGSSGMKREAVLENVRRYRTIASLHRQTAAFRPLQSWSLLGQAEEWEHLALAELEAYFSSCDSRTYDLRWEVPGKIAGFGGLACADSNSR